MATSTVQLQLGTAFLSYYCGSLFGALEDDIQTRPVTIHVIECTYMWSRTGAAEDKE